VSGRERQARAGQGITSAARPIESASCISVSASTPPLSASGSRSFGSMSSSARRWRERRESRHTRATTVVSQPATLFTPLASQRDRRSQASCAASSAFWFLVYSGIAITAVFLIAGIWGAGKSTMPLAGAPAGTPLREFVVAAIAYSSAPTGIVSFTLILWGLRMGTHQPTTGIDAAQSESSTPRN
jgi:hypothetical protein